MAQSQNSTSLSDTRGLANMAQSNVVIIYTEWNDKIVAELIAGAEKILQQYNAAIVCKTAVPGSFELPFACKHIYDTMSRGATSPDAIIAFGAVIRGGTPHFEYVCKAVTEGITQLNITLPVPVIFGVLTLDTEEQAWERLGGSHGHKGEEAALTALKMIQFTRSDNYQDK